MALRCMKCKRNLLVGDKAHAAPPPVGTRAVKCTTCGPWTYVEAAGVMQAFSHFTAQPQMRPLGSGCNCTGKR